MIKEATRDESPYSQGWIFHCHLKFPEADGLVFLLMMMMMMMMLLLLLVVVVVVVDVFNLLFFMLDHRHGMFLAQSRTYSAGG